MEGKKKVNRNIKTFKYKTRYYLVFLITGSEKTKLSFSSQAQYLVINEASVLWLINKIPNSLDLKKNTIMHRFRGNIILKGCNAFDEIQWKEIRIGNNNFKALFSYR